MNKKLFVSGLLLLAAASLPASLEAQVRLGLGAGPAFPMDHLAEEATTGFHVQGSVGLDLPILPVGLRADALWQRYPDEHEGNFDAIGGLLNARLDLPMPVGRPYLIGGLGLMRHEEPEIDHGDHAHGGERSTDFAFGLGAGFELRLLRLGGFVEARYLDWGDGNRGVPVTIGITF